MQNSKESVFGAVASMDADTAMRRTEENVAVEALAGQADAELLANLGYKQELKRNFSKLQIFGIGFSIIGTLPSITATMSYSLPAGPAGMVWGWFIAGGFIMIVGLAMADLGSSMPTSGGLYWWTHHFASPRTRNALSFLVGYTNSLGLIGGFCGVDYGFSMMCGSVISIARDGQWSPQPYQTYLIYMGCVLVHGIIASTAQRFMPKLQIVFVVFNLAVIMITIIVLPIGTSRNSSFNDASYIFGHIDNLTSWPMGWTFMLAWLSPIWVIGAFDSCVHMSEEASNAAKAVPYGIIATIAMAWGLGFVILIVIVACIDQNLENILDSPFQQPMAQIYFDSLGKRGALGMMSSLMVVQFMMGISLLVASSRQTWAFSRDSALPLSRYIRVISKRLGYIPIVAIWTCVLVALCIGLLCLIDPAAASAVFALGVAGGNLAWLIPIFSRVMWGQGKFVPGPFHTGRLSILIGWIAVIFLAFGIILAMFPLGGPSPTRDNMNYTIVIVTAVWGGSLAYYFISARNWFTGPKTTLDNVVLSEEPRPARFPERAGDVRQDVGDRVIRESSGDRILASATERQ